MAISNHLRGGRSRGADLQTVVLLSGLALAAGCGKTEPPRMPPPVVEVAPVIQKDVPIYGTWIGTLDGFVNAEIRSQVEGYLRRQVYREGFLVRAGDVLFEIDPSQFPCRKLPERFASGKRTKVAFLMGVRG